MIKVFTANKNGKIELTKDELKALLDEAYWDGYKANNHVFIYNTPNWNWTPPYNPYYITCSGTDVTINASELTLGAVDAGNSIRA